MSGSPLFKIRVYNSVNRMPCDMTGQLNHLKLKFVFITRPLVLTLHVDFLVIIVLQEVKSGEVGIISRTQNR